MGQHKLAPGLESVDGAQLGMFCGGNTRVSLAIDDRPDQRLLVREVVIELRVAHRGRGFDVLEGGRSHAAFMDQLGGGINDPDTGPLPLGCQGSLLARGAGPADDPNRAAMRTAPRTMLCGIAFRVHANVAGARFDELRELCTSTGDTASLAIAMAGLGGDHALPGPGREAFPPGSQAGAPRAAPARSAPLPPPAGMR